MDLVERYVHAVGFWLPRGQKRDIGAELTEDIRSEIEEKERERGRPLSEADVAGLLKERGSPFTVANSYLPQRHLIGPTLFPLYVFVLKVVGACYLVPWILVWIGFVAFDPSFRAAHGGTGVLRVLGAFWGDFWSVGLVVVGAVTVVFAVIERNQAGPRLLAAWDPHKLPPVRDPNRIPRGNSVAELAAGIVFGAWLMVEMSSPVLIDRPELMIRLAPQWSWFFWAYLVLSAATVTLAAANLVRPRWTGRRAAIRLASNLASTALFCVLCSSSIVAEIAIAGLSATRAQEIARAINIMTARAVPVVAGVGFVVLVFDVYRLWRISNTPGDSPAPEGNGGPATSPGR